MAVSGLTVNESLDSTQLFRVALPGKDILSLRRCMRKVRARRGWIVEVGIDDAVSSSPLVENEQMPQIPFPIGRSLPRFDQTS